MTDLKSYFHNKYQGGEDFINNVIIPIFGEDKYDDAYDEDVLENNPELTTMAQSTGVKEIHRLGTIDIPMNPTDVFDITVSNHVQMKRNRVAVQQLVRRIMSTYSSAFMVFHYDDDDKWDWRFTFCSKQGRNEETTDSKRYTFLLGPNQSCRTAAENFKKLAAKGGDIELDDIVKAFDVEALSAEFFQKYKEQYEKFVMYITGKKYVKTSKGWLEKELHEPHPQMYADFGCDDKRVRDYVKKLLGRIVFLYFLQKKGWLGATDDQWTNGSQNFMSMLFNSATAEQKSDFLDEILEPLYQCLDTPLRDRTDFYDTKVEGLRSVRIPFLGGLFERTNDDSVTSQFPEDYFAGLFKFLDEYNFTIDENDPNDAQVGVDPEMLGRIFENLLEDNKDKGAFYTPKEIVQYMCRESLIAYLQTGVTDEPTREALRQFVTTHDVSYLNGRTSPLAENVSRCLQNVKICDPAIGSGAFPIGLLNEIFLCRGVIEDFSNATSIKRHIIQQNIYGVDFERGAVEIARLRFWLSIVADAETPDLLPNLDFKIMQGNSLLESYKGFDLSHIMETKHVLEQNHQYSIFEDNIDVIRAEVKKLIQNYYTEGDSTQRSAMRLSIKDKIQRQIEGCGCNSVDILQIEDISATEKFFLWHTWFSEVFEEGGFDIVIGNPPYGVSIKNDYRKNVVKVLGQVPDYEIYYYFIQLSERILKLSGILTYIVPNTWLFNTYAKKYRLNLFETWNIIEVLDCTKFKLFASATVMNSIFTFRKECANSSSVGYRSTNSSNSFIELISKPRNTISKEALISMNQNWGLAFRLSKNNLCLIHKIANQEKSLSYFFDCSQGYIPYRLSDLVKAYGLEEGTRIKKERLWHSPTKTKDYWIQELYGRDITKYTYCPSGDYVKYGKHVATYVDLKYFNQKRVVVREITNPGIVATIVNETLLNDPQLLPLICKNNNNIISYESLWALLNSRLATFYHFNHSPKATKGAFPKVLIQDLKDFPVPNVSKEMWNKLHEKACFCIGLAQDECKIIPIEKEIDKIIYSMYGLSDQEIAIIESSGQ